MSTSVGSVTAAYHDAGFIVVRFLDGVELRFPVAGNRRLSAGSPSQLNRIEVSPYGLHWPDLDEDLSFAGLLSGDFGQRSPCCVQAAPSAEARP